MKKIFSLLFLTSSLFASFPMDVRGPILYKMHRGECEEALKIYLDTSLKTNSEDFELLQEACLTLLTTGMKKNDPETEFLCMFGAGISANPALIPILEKGLHSSDVRIQIVALHYLADMQCDLADELILEALSSPFLLTRLEAALELALKNEEALLDHLIPLFYKIPQEVRPLIAQIAAPLDTPAGTLFFEQLLNDQSRDVRLGATIEAGSAKREDLIPKIRKLLLWPDLAMQEAAISTLSTLLDEECKPFLHEVISKKDSPLRLIALKALHRFGEGEALSEIEEEAKAKNHDAIVLLKDCKGEKRVQEILENLLSSDDPTCRLNAAFSLISTGKMPPEQHVRALLLKGPENCGFMKQYSSGKALYHWRAFSGIQNLEKVFPTLKAETVELRGHLLKEIASFSETELLHVCRMVLEGEAYELVPLVMDLLCQSKSENVISFLKEMQQKTGEPFIRNYSNLALYKLGIEGPYEENLLKWVSDAKNHPLIKFKEDKGDKKNPTRYEFSPEETSQFLISAFETLATKQTQKARAALLKAMASGNEKNRYALSGLLMRTIE